MAALPRESDPGGAASLLWQGIALTRGSVSRKFGVLVLQGFSPGSAAEVLDEDSCEEGDGVEVGFGFGDGCDFGAAATEAFLKTGSSKSTSTSAVEADAVKVI